MKSTDSMQSLTNPVGFTVEWQVDSKIHMEIQETENRLPWKRRTKFENSHFPMSKLTAKQQKSR